MAVPILLKALAAAAKDEDADELNLELPKYLKPLGMKVSATDAGTRGIRHIYHPGPPARVWPSLQPCQAMLKVCWNDTDADADADAEHHEKNDIVESGIRNRTNSVASVASDVSNASSTGMRASWLGW